MRRVLVSLAVLLGIVVAGCVCVVAIGAGLVTGLMTSPPHAEAPVKSVYIPPVNPCPEVEPVAVGTFVVPRGPVAGYCQEDLINAATVMKAARDLKLGTKAQTVGVMTAIGESHLRNLDYGDDVGPDSRGLFQQRDNGAWGTLEERMNPYLAARSFFKKLKKVPGWKTMDPTVLAHRVQVNQDEQYYAQYWPDAREIVAALTPQAPPRGAAR